MTYWDEARVRSELFALGESAGYSGTRSTNVLEVMPTRVPPHLHPQAQQWHAQGYVSGSAGREREASAARPNVTLIRDERDGSRRAGNTQRSRSRGCTPH